MKRKLMIAATAATLLVVLTGCGKRYSPGCKKEANVTAPWSSMGLPVDSGRVCESDGQRAKMEFIGGSRQERATAFERSLTSSGFSKESCQGNYCIFAKDTQRVQVIVGDISNKWVTVSTIMSTGRSKSAANAGGNDANPPTLTGASLPAANAAAPTAAGGVDAIPECASYLSKLRACPPAKGPVSRSEEADMKKRNLQEKLDKGSRPDTIKRTCEVFERMLKC